MAITAKDIQALREATGVGMMECKKALTEAGGDMEKAIVLLRERGLAAAAKKAGRIAAEGMIDAYISEKDGSAVVLEVNIETDFAAKNDAFVDFVKTLSRLAADEKPADVEALSALPYPGGEGTVLQETQNKVLTIGENIQIRRFEILEGGASVVNASYIHMNGKIGVIISLAVSENLAGNADVVQLGKDLSMQAAAMRPTWVDRDSVPAERVASEKEILMAQTLNEGKPAQVAEKIVAGRINKFFEEFCLMEQAFIKEDKLSVKNHVAAVAKSLGGEIRPLSFVRFERGEGIAKKEENFAAEVQSMMK